MLTVPWALWALLSIPIVLGIYFFRTRSRRREVSALFLWSDRARALQGGRRLRRLQLPLLIFLELLTLALLAVAAARPMLRQEILGRPTLVILDASYSMTAAEPRPGAMSPKQRALDDLHRMLDAKIGYPVRFLLAGPKPELVPGRARGAAEARDMLDAWTCEAPEADLDAAVALASTIAAPGTKILVLTDHAPEGDVEPGTLLWKAYGKPLDNIALIHAGRVFRDRRDRLLLETANFSQKPQPLRMTILRPDRGHILFREDRTLEPGEVHRLRTTLPEEVGTIEVRLDDDALTLDNRLTLLAPSRRPVRVGVSGLPDGLASKIRRAVEVSEIGRIVTARPELRFAATVDAEDPAVWTVRFLQPDAASVKSFIGPFVLDPAAPVTSGLSLDGVIWSASPGISQSADMPGSPLISAGEVPLMTEQRRRDGSRILTIQYDDRLSTLTSSPAWPILIWNLLSNRGAGMVGVPVNNLKLGAEAEFVPAVEDRAVEITPPSGPSTRLEIAADRRGGVRIPADRVGVYGLRAESGRYEFAVGTLSAEESNLLHASSGVDGNRYDEETLRTDFRSIAWLFLLAALACLMLHHAIVSNPKETGA